MAGNFQFPEFLVANSVRAFPLSQAGTRLDTTGAINLPDSLLVSAAINATPDYVTGTFYISKVISLPDLVSIDLSFAPLSGVVRTICRITAPSTHVENTSYSITASGEDEAVTGSITIGSIVNTQQDLGGVFNFSPTSTAFEADCLFISVAQVKYLEMFNGAVSLGQFTDVIKLRAGRNIRLRYVGLDTIAIDAIDGLNLLAPDGCEQLPAAGDPILTINGIPPDVSGNFKIEGSDCIDIVEVTNGISIKDTCASSCCSCTELEELMVAQREVEAQLQIIRGQISLVQSNQTAMIVNLIGNLPS